jgi:hypothetical protein
MYWAVTAKRRPNSTPNGQFIKREEFTHPEPYPALNLGTNSYCDYTTIGMLILKDYLPRSRFSFA